MTVTWPEQREDYLRLAEALAALIGGRKDVAARYFEFKDKDRLVKGWAPWKGRAVDKDYKPMPGEVVKAFPDRNSNTTNYHILNPLTPDNLIDHLRGKNRLGVYVLDADNQCQFLAADFDDHKGQLDPAAVWGEVRRFVDACEAHDWRAQVERSKSGNGYHVWLFFDAPIPASHARAVGRWLFEESQTLQEDEDFSTFDRFFPAQSKTPPAGKGYGNLIGLPLFGYKEYVAGRTAWVDSEGEIIPDPLAHTLEILETGRNAADRIDAFMAEWELSPEEGSTYEGKERDPDAPLGTIEEYQAIVQRCNFVRWASAPNNQANLTEPVWFDLVSNMCRFDIDDQIHAASCGHPGYSVMETDQKIEHARSSSGPHTCKTIKTNGYLHCPVGGCKLSSGKATASPAGLAIWHQAESKKTKTTDRTVNVVEHETPPTTEDDNMPAPWPDNIPVDINTGMPWPAVETGWIVSNKGVLDHNNNYIALRPLWVDALTRNMLGLWGISIKFFDLDWRLKSYAFPRERLHEQGGVLGRELAAFGLPIMPGKEKWVSRYLVMQERNTQKRISAAGRLGWWDAPDSPAVFVLPTQVLGVAPEEIVYQPDVPMHTADTIHAQGTLQDWRVQVADQCKGNPILMFALMVGLGGPLLKLCQEQSGGFHIYGVTTGGKTTAVQVAASIWGCGADPQEGPEVTSIRKWYTTSSALESTAEIHNDSLLTLDEISEVDPHELGRIIYQLAGGLSKGRANAGGGLRAMRTWRLLFLSTGEKSVRQILAQVGQDQKGGQRVRLPDIPADDTEDGGRAIVMDAHGRDPKDFVQDLKSATAHSYGLAGPVFALALITEAEQLGGMAKLAGNLRNELKKM